MILRTISLRLGRGFPGEECFLLASMRFFNPKNSRGSSAITTQIVAGNSVETNGGNHADSKKNDYFARATPGSTTVGCSISGADLGSPGATTEFCAPGGMARYLWSVSGATISGTADGRCVQEQPMEGSCGFMVLLTTEDGSGNQASCYKEVKVADQVPPVAGYSPDPFDLGCNPGVEDYQPTLNPQWSDHCGIETTGVRAGTPMADVNVNGRWSVTHEYFAVDYAGNEATCRQVLSWHQCLAVTTAVADSITANSVVLGGEVTFEGLSSVMEREVCYGTTQMPTIGSGPKPGLVALCGWISGRFRH